MRRREDARDVFRPFDVSRQPEEAVGLSAQHDWPRSFIFIRLNPFLIRLRIHVSFVPPPWLELTTSEPVRQRHPGEPARHDPRPSLPLSTKGRKSTWRGASPLSTKVGQVDSASVGCAM